jgi:hypothetical protein
MIFQDIPVMENDMIWKMFCEILNKLTFELFKMVIVFQVRYFMFGF